MALSFVVSYGFAFAGLMPLYFLPTQKEEAQQRKQTWLHRPVFAYVSCGIVIISLIYSVRSASM